MAIERLQKILARGGLASRRAAEAMITEGRVRVNGRIITELGTKADARHDRIEVDGKRVVAEQPVYYALNKPRGFVTTMSDPEGRPTVADLLRPHGIAERVFPVGRLDFNTSGLLLLTNDGEFTDGMLHPKKAVPKSYVVKVVGVMEPKDIEKWREGVQLEDGKTLPADAAFLRFEEGKTWIEITIKEGRNQQIRRMGDATGFRVMRLSRTAFAGITSEGLRPGELRPLKYEELVELKRAYGVPRHPSVGKEEPVAPPRHKARAQRRVVVRGARAPGASARTKAPSERARAKGVTTPTTMRSTSPAEGAWGRDAAGRDRPQAARARHSHEREPEPTTPQPAPRQGGWRGHGPDDRDPREVPRQGGRRGARTRR